MVNSVHDRIEMSKTGFALAACSWLAGAVRVRTRRSRVATCALANHRSRRGQNLKLVIWLLSLVLFRKHDLIQD